MTDAADDFVLRKPTIDDGAPLHALIHECRPLEENSLYCNLLQCTHFANSCIVAERDGRLVGFISGYRLPDAPDVYFLWQVGVASEARGHGLALRMGRALLARLKAAGVRELNTTVTRSNGPSRAFFAALAREEGAELTEHEQFMERHFGGAGHEAEWLLRIAPLA
ncbi:MAG: diaminobutyrate acetyltransferase [Sandaracinaceae bacterium]